jgi:phosphopantetheine adenylyltransferase
MSGVLAIGLIIIAIKLTSNTYLKRRKKFELHKLNERLKNSENEVNELTEKLNKMIKKYEYKKTSD